MNKLSRIKFNKPWVTFTVQVAQTFCRLQRSSSEWENSRRQRFSVADAVKSEDRSQEKTRCLKTWGRLNNASTPHSVSTTQK